MAKPPVDGNLLATNNSVFISQQQTVPPGVQCIACNTIITAAVAASCRKPNTITANAAAAGPDI
jgi:hypothetical protein